MTGWQLAQDNSYLSHDFVFGNARSATKFMNEVSKFCTESDHHPEWQLNGRTLSVKLTSHFNNNKVSLKDFELADHMVYIYDKFGKEKSYKYWSPKNEVEISVFLAICGILILH